MYRVYANTCKMVDILIDTPLYFTVGVSKPSNLNGSMSSLRHASLSDQHTYQNYFNTISSRPLPSPSHSGMSNPNPLRQLAVRWVHVLFHWLVDPGQIAILRTNMDGSDEPTGYSKHRHGHVAFPHPTQIWRLWPLPLPPPFAFCSSACSRLTAVEIEGAAVVDSAASRRELGLRGSDPWDPSVSRQP